METVTLEKSIREVRLIKQILHECDLPSEFEIRGLTDLELYDAIRTQPDYEDDELDSKLVDVFEEFFRCILGFDNLSRLLRSLPRSM